MITFQPPSNRFQPPLRWPVYPCCHTPPIPPLTLPPYPPLGWKVQPGGWKPPVGTFQRVKEKEKDLYADYLRAARSGATSARVWALRDLLLLLPLSSTLCQILGLVAWCEILGLVTRCEILGLVTRCEILGLMAWCEILGLVTWCEVLGLVTWRQSRVTFAFVCALYGRWECKECGSNGDRYDTFHRQLLLVIRTSKRQELPHAYEFIGIFLVENVQCMASKARLPATTYQHIALADALVAQSQGMCARLKVIEGGVKK